MFVLCRKHLQTEGGAADIRIEHGHSDIAEEQALLESHPAGSPLMNIHAIVAAVQHCVINGACIQGDRRLVIIGLMILVGFVLIISGLILYMVRTEHTRH